jgi:RNA polymerase sigma-70 factor (ECF subfamily)
MRNLYVVGPGGDRSESGVRFEYLYRRHFQAVYAYFLRRVGAADVPDLVSDVFTIAWRRIERIPLPPNDRLWIYGVAHNCLSQHHRGRLRRDRLVARIRHNLQPHDWIPVETDAHLLALDLVNRLKPGDRELVRLIVWEQLSHAQVATVLGCSVNAVGIRWHRSIKRLRRHLEMAEDGTSKSSPGDVGRADKEGT